MTKVINTREVLSFAWEKTKAHPNVWIFALLLNIAAGGVSTIAPRMGILGPLFWLAGFFLPTVLTMGLIQLGIDAADDREPRLSTLGRSWRDVIGFMVTGFLYVAAIVAGTILLVVPGIVWTAQFLFATHFAVDRRMGPIAAMRASSRITKGVKYDLLVFSFALTLINIAGALLAGLGLFLTVPVSLIAIAFVYRQLCEACANSLSFEEPRG